jgi:hypothetical protein
VAKDHDDMTVLVVAVMLLAGLVAVPVVLIVLKERE